MDKLLTVIVPVYNVEKYLRTCLQSFVSPKLDSLEILIIDDGSTDSSNRIAREFVQKYPERYRLICKANGGHGSALNVGIREASGKYLKTVDGDDWLVEEELIRFLSYLAQTDTDVIVSNYYWIDTHTGKQGAQSEHPFEGVEYGKTYSLEDIAGKSYIKMHSLTIRTELAKRVPFAIDEHCYYVDSEFVMFPMIYAETVEFLDCYLYMYRVGRAHQSINISQMAKNKEQHLRVLYRLFEFYDWVKTQEVKEYHKRYLEYGIALILKSQYKVFLSCDYTKELREEMVSFDKTVQRDYPEIYGQMRSKSVRAIKLFGYRMFRPANRFFGILYKFFYR